MRGVTSALSQWRQSPDISTHTPHARRDIPTGHLILPSISISTHTPHARRDIYVSFIVLSSNDFYSHASCEAWRKMRGVVPVLSNFYSHASCEAWHAKSRNFDFAKKFLLTRLMRGVTAVEMGLSASLVISTHTPHARRDTLYDTIIINAPHFYSHASCEAWPVRG